MKRLATLLLAGTLLTHVSPVYSQEGEDPLQAGLYSGSCETPGQLRTELTSPKVPTGNRSGADAGVTAATSFTNAAIPLGEAFAFPYAIIVAQELTRSGIDAAPLACGDVGGFQDTNRSLALVLSSVNNSGISGVAFLTLNEDDDARTGVSLLLDPRPTSFEVSGSLDPAPSQAQPVTVVGVSEVSGAVPEIPARTVQIVNANQPVFATPVRGANPDAIQPIVGDTSSEELNCLNFDTQAQAQAAYDADPSDPDGLDGPPGPTSAGIPGVPCESLP